MSLTPRPPRPPRIPLPPLLLAGCLICGFALGSLFPLVVLNKPDGIGGLFVNILGLFLITGAVTIDFYAFFLFQNSKTTIRPDKAADALVTTGPFMVSRNPIYVGNVAILLGCGFISGIWVFAVLSLMTIWLLSRYQIPYEEAHMAHRFGPAWDRYAARVPRWV